VEEVPGARLTLGGHHWFSRYELVFRLDDTADGSTVLRAQTSPPFPASTGGYIAPWSSEPTLMCSPPATCSAPSGRSARLGTASVLLGLGNGPGGVDEADVAERLREVPDHLAAAGIDLLGQQADIVYGGRGTFEGRGGSLAPRGPVPGWGG
jgi:hypothetical protein